MQKPDNSQIDQSSGQILHPGSRKLFRYWEALRAERPCPERSEINLRNIADIMPNLVILEKNPTKNLWIYRLAGSELCELMQANQTGQDGLSGWDNFERDIISKSWAVSQDRKQPCLVRMRFCFEQLETQAAEQLLLPVYDAKSNQVQLFGGVFVFPNQTHVAATKFVRRELISARMIWTEHQAGDALMNQIGQKAAPLLRVIQGGLV